MAKIIDGVAPAKFNNEHLKSLGFTSSNDRTVIPLLKDLGFLSPEGSPLPRYHAYRDRTRSQAVMAEAMREAYEDVFHIREVPTPDDRAAIEGVFRSKHNSSDKIAQLQAMTFFGLLRLADMSATPEPSPLPPSVKRQEPSETPDVGVKTTPEEPDGPPTRAIQGTLNTELHYTIQVHLPATKDIEVFNAIFRSLRENLLS